MEHMILERRAYLPQAVLGNLHVEDQVFATLENPWRNNLTDVSCIPEGFYVARHASRDVRRDLRVAARTSSDAHFIPPR